MKPRHLSILYVLVPVLAVLTTLATGLLWRPGEGTTEYGFPLPWKTEEIIPTCFMCPLPTSYNWSFFILDAAFYATIGYGIVLLYKRLERNQQDHLVDPDKTTKQ
jgi:hypothetical protein